MFYLYKKALQVTHLQGFIFLDVPERGLEPRSTASQQQRSGLKVDKKCTENKKARQQS